MILASSLKSFANQPQYNMYAIHTILSLSYCRNVFQISIRASCSCKPTNVPSEFCPKSPPHYCYCISSSRFLGTRYSAHWTTNTNKTSSSRHLIIFHTCFFNKSFGKVSCLEAKVKSKMHEIESSSQM